MKKDIFTRLRNGEAIDMQTDEDYKGTAWNEVERTMNLCWKANSVPPFDPIVRQSLDGIEGNTLRLLHHPAALPARLRLPDGNRRRLLHQPWPHRQPRLRKHLDHQVQTRPHQKESLDRSQSHHHARRHHRRRRSHRKRSHSHQRCPRPHHSRKESSQSHKESGMRIR